MENQYSKSTQQEETSPTIKILTFRCNEAQMGKLNFYLHLAITREHSPLFLPGTTKKIRSRVSQHI
jgi:hypothetical protein